MDSKKVSSTIAQFAAKFVNELDKTQSVVSSPLSAEFVLGVLALGSSDPAHQELLTALGITNDDDIRKTFGQVSSKIKSAKGVTLNVANRLYLKEGPYELEPRLDQDAAKVFDAGIEKINFGNSSAAANTINSWVESKTSNHIKNLIPPSSLGEDTRLVLVNALYFKGTWKLKFDPKDTTDKPFNVDSKTVVQVPMMYKEAKFKYAESTNLKAQLLEMQYQGDDTSMLIVLPNDVEGLNPLMQKLAGGYNLTDEFEKMQETKVQVLVPKFKIETEIDLNILLPKLGIKAIFDTNNSGMDKLLKSPEKLYVSKAIQKAFIEVNEEGAEAAAATAAEVRARRALPPQFVVDRPALVLVMMGDHMLLTVRYQPAPPSSAGARDEL